MKASVIDLGYNSAKMVSFVVDRAGQFRPFRQDGFKAKLGEGLNETGFLGVGPMRRAIECLKILHEITELESVERVLPVATSAVREAANGKAFLEAATRETGLAFKVLSAREEALYSFAGAVGFVPTADAVFFDLGGGSLEIVHMADSRIKKIMSLPLGALRLSLAYGIGDGTLAKKDFNRMKERVERLLPDGRELKLSNRTKLIGVGGSVRAIARFHQMAVDYPFSKIQGYSVSYESVSWISRSLLRMSHKELSRENSIGNRAETIGAGAYVVRTLMRTLGFDELNVSAHGLREGTLSMYLRDPRAFHSGNTTEGQVERFVSSAARTMLRSTQDGPAAFEQARLATRREAMLLSEGLRLSSQATPTVNLRALFFSLLEEDSPFDHREQLLIALAAVSSKNERVAEQLARDFAELTTRVERKSVKRLSALLAFAETARRVGAGLKVARDGRELTIKVHGSKSSVPVALLTYQAEAIADAMDLRLSISFGPSSRELLPRVGVAK